MKKYLLIFLFVTVFVFSANKNSTEDFKKINELLKTYEIKQFNTYPDNLTLSDSSQNYMWIGEILDIKRNPQNKDNFLFYIEVKQYQDEINPYKKYPVVVLKNKPRGNALIDMIVKGVSDEQFNAYFKTAFVGQKILFCGCYSDRQIMNSKNYIRIVTNWFTTNADLITLK